MKVPAKEFDGVGLEEIPNAEDYVWNASLQAGDSEIVIEKRQKAWLEECQKSVGASSLDDVVFEIKGLSSGRFTFVSISSSNFSGKKRTAVMPKVVFDCLGLTGSQRAFQISPMATPPKANRVIVACKETLSKEQLQDLKSELAKTRALGIGQVLSLSLLGKFTEFSPRRATGPARNVCS
ncbi:uncharacterized protein LOC132194160 [Neocloeon triangulifer]|uniref:uncharacterized protein LOC132194160 n=1 Tax=Neocloeon triangulifer TaxID=2078957 RepID=UPI00286F8F1B|nr:uncharacterized protein LOC132194160 [Neocloeon triangulifer]